MSEQVPILPRADTLKRRIDPLDFYQAEIQNLPPPKDGPWLNEISCPFHNEDSPSFGVNLETGGFNCFGCGVKGASIIDFTMQHYGLEFDEARRKLADEWKIQSDTTPQYIKNPHTSQNLKADPDKKPITPIPALADSLPAHPRYGQADAVWTYRNPEGRPLFHVCRFDLEKGRKTDFTPNLDKGWVAVACAPAPEAFV